MKLFRNQEIGWYLSGFFVTIGTVCIVYLIVGKNPLYYLLAEGILCSALYLLCMKRRYEDVEKLTQKIDRILHGEDQLELGEYQEGDLEILKDEIYKMTVRLREQNEHLKKEKTFLADALANISHQIRTPLTSVNLMLERIRKQDLEERQKRKIYREMAEMLQRMEWLILGLLKISKLDAGAVVLDKQRIQVEPFIREVVRSLEIPMELREQKLILKGTSDAAFYGDASWTMEAVGNVLKNCMEHTPIGGTIRIAWEENPLYTELSVTDSGNGIDEKDLPHIFERFYKGRISEQQNFGIGLSLARSILTQEKAIITAKNNKEGEPDFLFVFMGEKKKWKSDKFVMKKSSKCHVGQVYLFLETKRRKKDGNSKNRKPDKSVWKR
ncbi:MAG: sensor histidine kinase [Sellimonas intestinalis]|uniref:sensor histidine kinase n=1 Tax=Sellimonas intestinalis TaxID=1653434 RepID=UPI0039A3E651